MIIEPFVPPITDPLGRYWQQPPRSAFVLDDTHAVMTQRTFDLLPEYSRSYPTGVYPGKMWKAILRDGSTWLRWYGYAAEGYCSNHQRRILLTIDQCQSCPGLAPCRKPGADCQHRQS